MKKPIVEFPVETACIDELCLIGTPIAWPSKDLPNGRYVWVEGQQFDMVTNPKLAMLFPSGFLPDPRWDFIQYVGKDQEALVKTPQSVQPLTFIGDTLDPHIHQTSVYGVNGKYSGDGYSYDSSIVMGASPAWGNKVTRTDIAIPVSGGISSGTITGTGDVTKPQSMSWYCIMRVR